MEREEALATSEARFSPARKSRKRELNTLEIIEIEILVDKEIERIFQAKKRSGVSKGILLMLAWGAILMMLMTGTGIDSTFRMLLMAAVSGGFMWFMIKTDTHGLKEKEAAKKDLLAQKIKEAEGC